MLVTKLSSKMNTTSGREISGNHLMISRMTMMIMMTRLMTKTTKLVMGLRKLPKV